MRRQQHFDHSGFSFDSFLREEGLLEESEAVAVKRVIASKLSQAMTDAKVTKKLMAQRLRTSRAQVDRLLDPTNVTVSLQTVSRAARALGKRITVQVVDVEPRRKRRNGRKTAA